MESNNQAEIFEGKLQKTIFIFETISNAFSSWIGRTMSNTLSSWIGTTMSNAFSS